MPHVVGGAAHRVVTTGRPGQLGQLRGDTAGPHWGGCVERHDELDLKHRSYAYRIRRDVKINDFLLLKNCCKPMVMLPHLVDISNSLIAANRN